MRAVRLTDRQIEGIKSAVREVFGDSARVYLFGSRTDISKKGGDIDLLVLVEDGEDMYQKKIQLLGRLYKVLGERKIDLIVTDRPETDIEKHAITEGIEL
ncbi:nucleotidyltransferase domain-containing protein [Persephonella sp.]